MVGGNVPLRIVHCVPTAISFHVAVLYTYLLHGAVSFLRS